MSCCGLLPLLRQRLRRRQMSQPPTTAPSMENSATQTNDTTSISLDSDLLESPVVVPSQKPAPRVSEVEYVATGYCGLCRAQLPHNPLPEVDRTTATIWQPWEKNLRAVLNLDPKTANSEDYVVTAEFHASPDDVDASKTVGVQHSNYDQVNVELKIAMLDDTLAYIVHSWCHEVLVWRSGINNPKVVYELAEALSHECSPWETMGLGEGWLDAPSRIKTLIGDMNDEQSSRLQPEFLSQLPAELRAPIWGFVGMRSAYSSFLLVGEVTSKLVHLLRKELPRTREILLTKGSFISTQHVNIFGTSYLREITNEVSNSAVEILETVTAIKLIASLPGICAMKLVGETWESDWIGQKPIAGQIWYGTVHDPGESPEATFTGLTCLFLKGKTLPQMFWDRSDFPARIIDRTTLKDEAQWLLRPSISQFDFIRYLPLFRGTELANGLTVFCSPTGVIGMAAHFKKKTYFSGYRDGVPMYVSFSEGEFIKHIWYRLCERPLDPPSFTIMTNQNRTYHFGAHYSDVHLPGTRWCPMNNYEYSSITGIFYQNPRREFYCSGVLGKGRGVHRPMAFVSPIPQAIFPTISSIHRYRPAHGAFLSTAIMTNVKYLNVCKVGKRYIGMLVTYEDGSNVALGQWFPPDTNTTASYEEIYDIKSSRKRGQPAIIRFCYSDPPDRIVTSISVRYSDDEKESRVTEVAETDYEIEDGEFTLPLPEPDLSFTDVPWNHAIKWWFSRAWDVVDEWGEDYSNIPIEHHSYVQ